MFEFIKKMKKSQLSKKKSEQDKQKEFKFQEQDPAKMIQKEMDKQLFNPLKHN